MKTVGIIGGMSWESSLEYYRILNQWVKNRLWWHHSAKIILYSVDFDEIKSLQFAGEWEKAWMILSDTGRKLEEAGADFLLLATNTMHKVAPDIQASVSIPLIHIADGTGERIAKSWYRKIWLLGTRFTMDQDFYSGRLREKYWLDILVPNESEKDIIHRVIYDELCLWKISEISRDQYITVIDRMKSQWAEAVILWCTEISLLIDASSSPLPIFDTTAIHVNTALEFMLT